MSVSCQERIAIVVWLLQALGAWCFWEESNTVELRVTGVALSSWALTEEMA